MTSLLPAMLIARASPATKRLSCPRSHRFPSLLQAHPSSPSTVRLSGPSSTSYVGGKCISSSGCLGSIATAPPTTALSTAAPVGHILDTRHRRDRCSGLHRACGFERRSACGARQGCPSSAGHHRCRTDLNGCAGVDRETRSQPIRRCTARSETRRGIISTSTGPECDTDGCPNSDVTCSP